MFILGPLGRAQVAAEQPGHQDGQQAHQHREYHYERDHVHPLFFGPP